MCKMRKLCKQFQNEKGTVYFIVSAMVAIFVNLGEGEESEWSAYRWLNH